jgi:hypothetical protein
MKDEKQEKLAPEHDPICYGCGGPKSLHPESGRQDHWPYCSKFIAKDGLPSAADLDAVAEEQRITAATSDVALAHSAFKAPVLAELETPLVHSTLLEMIGLANAGRCMNCRGEIDTHVYRRHVECPVKFAERHPEYLQWKQRVQVLMLATKYANGELGKVSNSGDVRDAATGER